MNSPVKVEIIVSDELIGAQTKDVSDLFIFNSGYYYSKETGEKYLYTGHSMQRLSGINIEPRQQK